MADKIISTMFDDDLEEDFLSSWKPSNTVTRDKSLKVHEVQPTKAKRKPFTSPKLDIDFDIDASFEMPSFDIDLAGLDFTSTPPVPKSEINKVLDDTDGFSVDIQGSDNLDLDDSRRSKVDSPAPTERSVNRSVPREVSEPAQNTHETRIGDVLLPGSNLRQKKLADIEALDPDEQCSPEKRDQVLIITNEEKSECGDQTDGPSSHKFPVVAAQVESEPVNNNDGRNLSQNFGRPKGQQTLETTPHSNPYKSEKSSSEAQSVSLPAKDHVKGSEVEQTARSILHSTSFENQLSTDPHLSVFKTSRKVGLLDSAEGRKIEQDAMRHTDSKFLSSAPAKDQESLVSEDVGPPNSCLTRRPEDDGSTEEEKLVGGMFVENSPVLPECREHVGEVEGDKPDPVAPPVNEEKQNLQEEAIADPLECRPVFAIPGTSLVHLDNKTLRTSTNDHQLAKEHFMKKHSNDGSVPIREMKRIPITSRLNLLSGNSILKERKVVKKLNNALSRFREIQSSGSTPNPMVKPGILPPEEREHQAEGECTNNEERNLANGQKKKDKRQVRFQTMEKPKSKLQFQTVAKVMRIGDESKQTQGNKPNLNSAGFNVLSSSRLALTTTTANAEQSGNRTIENRLLRIDKLRTGLVAQSERVQRGSSDVVQKKNGPAELAKSKNVRMNKITSDNKFAFGQIQVSQSIPERMPTKYAGLPFSSKKRTEPEDLDPGVTAPKKNQRNSSTCASPLQYSPMTIVEREAIETRARGPVENQEGHDGKESTKNIANAESAAAKTQSHIEVLISERKNIIERANQYSDKLDYIMKTLKQLNGDAKDMIVRALVCNNKLLMIQTPRNEEKMMKGSILEMLSTKSDIMEVP